jgi:Flp pilus assembly protein TadG
MIIQFHSRRGGAALVELAFVAPVWFFLVLAIIVGGMGIFRYQETCYLAHEGARYASVHGTDYAADTGNSAATASDVYNNAILPRILTLDPNSVSYTVTWNQNNSPFSVTNNYDLPVRNTVTVTVSYTWVPEWFLAGPITLTGTSTVPMYY